MAKDNRRRQQKQAVREARERAAREKARRDAVRRIASFAAAGVLAVAAITLLNRVPAAQPLSDAAVDAARSAGCDNVELSPQLTDEVPRDHFPTGESTSYPSQPPTAGNHAVDPLESSARVLTTPPDEARAVHTLEHGSVILAYRPPQDPGGVTQAVIDALGPIATSGKATYLAPSASLPDGTGLSFEAWNVVVNCPGTITVAQATAFAHGFIDALACTDNAPEAKSGDGC